MFINLRLLLQYRPQILFFLQHGNDEGWTNLQDLKIEGEGSWARSASAVTHGIWIWNRPFIVNGVS